MFKLAIFDIDGVLVNTTDIHTEALRLSIASLVSPEAAREDYLDASDGIRTIDKLRRLQSSYGLSDHDIKSIDSMKSMLTTNAFAHYPRNEMLVRVLSNIKAQGVLLSIGSNSRRSNVDFLTQSLGIFDLLDFSVAGNEVKNPKPAPDVFLASMSKLNVKPEDTIIFEDSDSGYQAALATGAIVVRVNPVTLVTEEQLLKIVNS
jgi:HAD superfamily hydrolase (TIGR01509 family)